MKVLHFIICIVSVSINETDLYKDQRLASTAELLFPHLTERMFVRKYITENLNDWSISRISYCTNDLHFTKLVGGIPNFFFLLSVPRLKKNPHVGLPTVVNGAIEFAFLISPDGVIRYCVDCLLRERSTVVTWVGCSSCLWNR